MKVASFSVRATLPQSERWHKAADSEGYASVGAWLANAADSYLQVRSRAGRPLALSWRRGRFRVCLDDGSTPTVPGWISPPFAHFRGDEAGPRGYGSHLHTLVVLATGRVVASFRFARLARLLASELAPVLIRGGPLTPAESVIERHRREAV